MEYRDEDGETKKPEISVQENPLHVIKLLLREPYKKHATYTPVLHIRGWRDLGVIA
jgi:hypothetical protein